MSNIVGSRFLFTKFTRPNLRPLVVDRPRLLDVLNQGRYQTATLVSGPAGSGKSTLLSAWLSQSDGVTAWLSLDAADDEPRRFLGYLTEALRLLVPRIASDVTSVLASREEIDTQAFLQSLILPVLHEKALSCILVIDDIHLLTNPFCRHFLKTLIHYKPNGLHIALASRTEPDLGLVTLRAKAQLNDIRADDLRFRGDEAGLFYNTVMDLDLDADMVARLESRTEGWIAACQLAALRIKRSANRKAIPDCLAKEGTLVAEYLAEEVLQHLPPTLQDFLLTTSVLHRMCDSLCCALMGTDHPIVTLRELEKDNLFVYALDDRGYWYRYHHLLAGFLRNRIKKILPARLPELHKKASEWFAAHGLIQEAVEHAILAKDQQFLAALIENRFADILFYSELGVFRRGLEEVDKQLFYQRPRLALADAWCALYSNVDADRLDFFTGRVQTALQHCSDTLSAKDRSIIEVSYHMLRAINCVRRGKYSIARDIAEQAKSGLADSSTTLAAPLYLIIGSAHVSLGDLDRAYAPLNRAEYLGIESKNYLIALTAICFKATICNLRQELRQTYQICASALRLANEKGCGLLPIVGSLHVELGLCYFYQGEYKNAQIELERGIHCYSLLKIAPDIATAYCFLARLKYRLGDIEGTRAALQEGLATAHKVGNTDNICFVLSYQALFALQRGDLAEAQTWAKDHSADNISNVVLQEHVHLVRVTVMLFTGLVDEVLEEIPILMQRNIAQGFLLYALILQIIRVVSLARLGRDNEASKELVVAARQAMPEGVRVYFQVWGPQREWSATIRKLLGRIDDTEVRNFLSALVGDFQQSEDGSNWLPSREPISVVQSPDLPAPDSPLTGRETEVLKLLSYGMSNREIAKQLFVSIPTIKTHIQRIYRKLEVKNRTAAVRAARERRIFDGGQNLDSQK